MYSVILVFSEEAIMYPMHATPMENGTVTTIAVVR